MEFIFTEFNKANHISISVFDSIIKLDEEHFPLPWNKNSWREFLNGHDFYLLCIFNSIDHNDLFGFILFDTNAVDSFAHLLKIVINPKYRNHKLGTELLNLAQKNLIQKQISKLFLEVEITNLNAIKLYENAGFKLVHKNLNFYGKDRHALIMINYDNE